MLIGVTGQIGAGKSVVASSLARRGALLVDADKIGRQVTGSPAVMTRLVRVWGEAIRTSDGSLRPGKLAEIVFGDSSGSQLERFNTIIRDPLGKAVWQALRRAERVASARKRPAPVVLDAALLPDWEISTDMNLIILVTATRARRLKRLLERGMDPADAKARMSSQSPLRMYREVADVALTNNTTLADLEKKTERLWQTRIVPHL